MSAEVIAFQFGGRDSSPIPGSVIALYLWDGLYHVALKGPPSGFEIDTKGFFTARPFADEGEARSFAASEGARLNLPVYDIGDNGSPEGVPDE